MPIRRFGLLVYLFKMLTAQTQCTYPRSTLHHGLFSLLLCANDAKGSVGS